MINQEKIKNIEDNKNYKNNDKDDTIDNFKKNLMTFLEIELKESEDKIIKQKINAEKEIIKIYNRLNKEIEKSRKFSLEKLITDFLPIFDNIERALHLKEIKSNENFLEVFNKLKSISDALQKLFNIFNIKKIDDINVLFDPSIHQAMSIHYTNDMKSNRIVTVMQPGYLLYEDRLLRPAMVVVSKKKT